MLQRIQTVYLLLALACLAMTFAFPYAELGESITFDNQRIEQSIDADNTKTLKGLIPFPLAYLVISLIGLLLFTLLQYRNRKTQMILGRIGYLLILGLVVVVYLTIDRLAESNGIAEAAVTHGYSTYLPVLALVFLFLSNRAIRKDEELVKSLDRLR